ncbi:ARS-binding protein 2 [Apiospora aurea]|uniref:ARS-binding protein 2 n=1 Tax=Apiospora aurea TaxID=335848 RepID=A0ABR1Q782_9PEZI
MNTSHPAPPSTITIVSPRAVGTRPALPDRRVTETTIEDAYVSFILHCNPAVPLETNTGVLRESFRAPPKSDGKTFSTFTLYELISQLETKELKTWAELALRLGVTPPDQDKGQSSQKIQQYAVRLKRWMHSMHLDAFFDYLIGRSEHVYWTQIPTDPDPICEGGRDGVAAEDDMALRALLPQIRPRRGRRKPEDDLNKSPSQRPRLSPPLSGETRATEPWTAHPDSSRTFMFPPPDQLRSSILPGPSSTWNNDASQTPLSAYPQSAMTPVNGKFWADEPRSALTPSRAKLLSKRHGAKVVSSAWRSGGAGTGGKTRGRPPINRISEGTPPASADVNRSSQSLVVDSGIPESVQSAITPTIVFPPQQAPTSAPAPTSSPSDSMPSQASRTARPGRLSLQVPERVGGSVRLATPPPPPPAFGVNHSHDHGDSTIQTMEAETIWPTLGDPESPEGVAVVPGAESHALKKPPIVFEYPGGDRENMAIVESWFVSDILVADWHDANDNKIASCGVDEALALAKQIINGMAKKAPSAEVFLLNVSAIMGGCLLRSKNRPSIKRLETGPEYNRYTCRWYIQYGTLVSEYTLNETLPHDTWQKERRRGEKNPGQARTVEAEEDTAEFWKQKYQELLHQQRANIDQVTDLRVQVFEAVKKSSAS